MDEPTPEPVELCGGCATELRPDDWIELCIWCEGPLCKDCWEALGYRGSTVHPTSAAPARKAEIMRSPGPIRHWLASST